MKHIKHFQFLEWLLKFFKCFVREQIIVIKTFKSCQLHGLIIDGLEYFSG